MKKLFFTALVATVAVGGATLSANADTFFTSTGQAVTCDTGDITCGERFEGQTLYDAPPLQGGNPVDPSEYENLGFQN